MNEHKIFGYARVSTPDQSLDMQIRALEKYGCDGARLCMAGEASDRANRQNVEGMWQGKTPEQRKAAMSLMGDVFAEKCVTTKEADQT